MSKDNGVSFLESIGAFVRRKRAEQDIGLRALAAACEISPDALSRVERNEDQPSTDLCDRIAAALNTSVDVVRLLAATTDYAEGTPPAPPMHEEGRR